MLNDRDIALSVLEMTKHEIEDLTKASMESSGQLRQMLIQMRNQCEQDQTALAQYAIQNNWYLPAAPVNVAEVQKVAGFYQSSVQQPTLQ